MRFMQACCAATALAALAAPANSATIIQDFGPLSIFGADTVQAFNSGLGTLDSVVIDARAGGDGGAVRSGSGGLPEVDLPASGGFAVNLGTFGASENLLVVILSGQTHFAAGATMGPCSVRGTGSVTITSNLGRFIGGGTVPLVMGASGMSCSGGQTNMTGSGTITYNYTPGGSTPAVPEPATWAMLIAGFGLTGGAMRRKTVTRAARAA